MVGITSCGNHTNFRSLGLCVSCASRSFVSHHRRDTDLMDTNGWYHTRTGTGMTRTRIDSNTIDINNNYWKRNASSHSATPPINTKTKTKCGIRNPYNRSTTLIAAPSYSRSIQTKQSTRQSTSTIPPHPHPHQHQPHNKNTHCTPYASSQSSHYDKSMYISMGVQYELASRP